MGQVMSDNTVTDILVSSSSAMVAIGLALILNQAGGLDAALSVIAGIVIFLAAAQAHAMAIRLRERRLIEEELLDLRQENERLAGELLSTSKRVTSMVEGLESRTTARSQKVVSEVKILETLIRQFADQVVSRVKQVEQGQHARVQGGGDARTLQQHLHDGLERGALSAQPGLKTIDDPRLLSLIQSSLVENRVDLHLQPVVTLPQRKLRFYEGLTRLRTSDGKLIMPSQYLRVAEPAGLMSTIDNLLLFRCVQIMQRLAQKSSDTGVFCNISAHSLKDQSFFPQFIEFMKHHRELSGQLIFEFSQGTLDAIGPAEEASLHFLADLGFSFSLDHVTRLDLDVRRLRLLGFRHVKVPASLLLDSSAKVAGKLDRNDLRLLLERNGINLIAERIETERQVVDILDMGIVFGQGYLFGEPRPLREGVVDGAADTAPLPLKRAVA